MRNGPLASLALASAVEKLLHLRNLFKQALTSTWTMSVCRNLRRAYPVISATVRESYSACDGFTRIELHRRGRQEKGAEGQRTPRPKLRPAARDNAIQNPASAHLTISVNLAELIRQWFEKMHKRNNTLYTRFEVA